MTMLTTLVLKPAGTCRYGTFGRPDLRPIDKSSSTFSLVLILTSYPKVAAREEAGGPNVATEGRIIVTILEREKRRFDACVM